MSDEVDGVFDERVVLLTSRIDLADVERLSPNEAAIVAGAVEKRRREFATGRRLAREALSRLGVEGFELLRDANHAPIWPACISGSLSHCSTTAVVAAGRRGEVGTLGIDVEERVLLGEDVWPAVLRPEERGLLDTVPAPARGRLALAMFCAKESLYKAQYPRTRRLMSFADVRVDIVQVDRTPRLHGTLACVFQTDIGEFAAGDVISCRFQQMTAGMLLATVQIRGGE